MCPHRHCVSNKQTPSNVVRECDDATTAPFEVNRPHLRRTISAKFAVHTNESIHEIELGVQGIWRYASTTNRRVQIRCRFSTEHIDESTKKVHNIQSSVADPLTCSNAEVLDLPDIVDDQEVEEPTGFDRLSDEQQRKERHAFKVFAFVQSRL